MANRLHLNWLAEGKVHWNKRRKKVDFSPDLSDAKLFDFLPPDFRGDPKTSRYFEGFNFSDADFSKADLSGLNFSKSNFSRARLDKANLSKSNFERVRFDGASLKGADCSHSLFSFALFDSADVTGADFSQASLEAAAFIAVNMSHSERTQVSARGAQIYASRSDFDDLSVVGLGESTFRVLDAGPPQEGLKKDLRTKKNKYDVFYGTNRAPIMQRGALVGFDGMLQSDLRYGVCEVLVPDSHRIGSIGSRLWKRLLNMSDDRLKVESIIDLSEELFWSYLVSGAGKMKTKSRPTVFVHGFNTDFEDAVLRAAQIGFDLGLGQGIGLFSWASKGWPQEYPADEASVEASKYQLASFLEGFIESSSGLGVNIIGHSMGCRCVLGALEVLNGRNPGALGEVYEVILAAADVDANLMPYLSTSAVKVSGMVTSYVSDKDKALKVSGWLHSYPRVGVAPPIFIAPGIDTILVNDLDLGKLAHSYVASSRTIIGDMFYVLKDGLAPSQRHSLELVKIDGGEHWKIRN